MSADAPPEQRLLGFVRNFIARLFDDGWLGRLMAREMIEPSPALDLMIAERIRPMAQQLGGIIRAIVGEHLDEETVWLCGFSIVSQCVFYNHCRSVVSRLLPEPPLTPQTVDRLARHITQFSLAALQSFAHRAPKARRPGKRLPWEWSRRVRHAA